MTLDYKKNSVWAENLTIVMQLGLTMAGCIVLCFFAGRYVDQWFGTRGIFITLFTVFGVIGGANVAYRQIIEITTIKNDVKKESSPKKDGND